MQLWHTPTSPFARKARIAALELGLGSQIELVEVDPWCSAELRRLNPLAKVPILVLANGQVLSESTVICDYLDSLGPKRRLFPLEGAQRWRALGLQSLADGAATAAEQLYADEHRPVNERSDLAMDRQRLAIASVLDALEATPPAQECCTIGEIAAAALLGYIDFRWPDRQWRQGRPNLAAWFGDFSPRTAIVMTEHRPADAN